LTTKYAFATAVASCMSLLLQLSWAQDANVEWNGFVAQGLINAKHSSFVNNDEGWSAELTELGLNTCISLSPSFSLAGQVVYLNGGNRYPPGMRLDYLFADWNLYNSLDWQANIYIGRFKNQHWLYSSTRDVPFTRPSIVLPQSVYFDAFRDIAVGSDGIAMQARHSGDVGDVTFNWSWGSAPISDQQTRTLLGAAVRGSVKQDFVHQASVYWQPAMSRLTFGVSLLDSNFSYTALVDDIFAPADFTVQRVMANVRYQLEKWEFSTELQQERLLIDGFFAPQFHQDQMGQGAYLLAQYRNTSQLKWFMALDYMVLNKDDRRGTLFSQNSGGTVPAYFAYQYSVGTGLSYDFTPTLQLSAEIHWMEGTGRVAPVVIPNLAVNTREYWQLYAVQLMYRF